MGLNGQFNARIQRLEKMVENTPSGTEVPQPSVADYGKVISVDENGEYSLENVPQEVPTPTEIDAGKVVKVNASGTGYELAEVGGSGLPDFTSNDIGKVLAVEMDDDGPGTPTIAVPEQTVVADGTNSVLLSNCLLECFVPGFEVSLVVNNQELSGILTANGDAVGVIFQEAGIAVMTNNNEVYFIAQQSGSYTVEATIYVKDAVVGLKNLEQRTERDNDYEIFINDVNGNYTTPASFSDAMKALIKGCNVYFSIGRGNTITALAYYIRDRFYGEILEFNGTSSLQVTVYRIEFSLEELNVITNTYPN